jgi:hypothetical protein
VLDTALDRAASALSLTISSAESGNNGKGDHGIVSDGVRARSEWHNVEDVLTVFNSPIAFLAIPVSVLVSMPYGSFQEWFCTTV